MLITLFRSNKILTLSELMTTVSRQIQQLPNMVSPLGDHQKILRYEYKCEPIDLLAWLHNQSHAQKLYWSDRNGDFEIAGIGIADCIEGLGAHSKKHIFEHVEDHLSINNPRLRYYGGFAFSDSGQKDVRWSFLGAYRFIVPQFEFFYTGAETIFAFNIALQDIEEKKLSQINQTLKEIDFSNETQYRKVPQIQTRDDSPDHEHWNQLFTELDNIKKNQVFKKIVLARQSKFTFDVKIRPSALIKHLKGQTPNCYHFCMQSGVHNAFLGATPERLYKLNGQKIESEALAGTIRRGKDENEDRALENELLNSAKNTHEHQLVVEALSHDFNRLCSSFNKEDTFNLLKLKEAHHLLTKFEGTLAENLSNAEILAQLHPTPAVAGYPQKETIDIIHKLEPFERGWYAGPIGYIGHDETEFAVGIRSGLVSENTLSIFAGAGIVEGSDVNDEWNEIENKISRFMKVFGQ